VSRAPNDERGAAMWLCKCDCGNEGVFGGSRLRTSTRTHCWNPTHKARPKPLTVEYRSEYQSWMSMRARCFDPAHVKYPVYGGRGITVDPRWGSFKSFMLDMGRKPDPRFTIEREDVNGNYEPKNCKWISRKDQGRNKRNSVFVTYKGRRMLLIDLVEELGLSRNVVYQRLKLGWTLAQAIALPLHTVAYPGARRGRPHGACKKKPVAISQPL
jgi:hypothetical protein